MKKSGYYYLFLGILLLSLTCSVLEITGVVPYAFWRWSLLGILALFGIFAFFFYRTRQKEKEFEIVASKPQRIVLAAVAICWAAGFFGAALF